eukprot:6420739-Lingulodinium_polyedra.AAC.1
MVYGHDHELRLAVPKCMLLLEAGLQVVATAAPLVQVVSRLVGKLSFAQSFLAGARSLLFATYRWLALAYKQR